MITASADSTIRVWSVPVAQQVQFLKIHDSSVTGISLHPLGDYLLSCSLDEHWAFSDIRTGKMLIKVSSAASAPSADASDSGSGSPVALTCAKFHPDGLIFGTGTADSVIKIWDLRSKTNLANFPGHMGPISCLSFSENGFFFWILFYLDSFILYKFIFLAWKDSIWQQLPKTRAWNCGTCESWKISRRSISTASMRSKTCRSILAARIWHVLARTFGFISRNSGTWFEFLMSTQLWLLAWDSDKTPSPLCPVRSTSRSSFFHFKWRFISVNVVIHFIISCVFDHWRINKNCKYIN